MNEIVHLEVDATSMSGLPGLLNHDQEYKVFAARPLSAYFQPINISQNVIVKKCLIYFTVLNPITTPHNLRISLSNNQDTSDVFADIDYGEYEEDDNNKYVYFDITHRFYELITGNYSVYVKPQSGTYYFAQSPAAHLVIEYIKPFAYLQSQKSIEESVGENIQYSINLNSSLLNLKKNLFNDILPYPLSLTYDDYDNSQYYHLPYRFKLSIFEQLVFQNNGSILYIDGNYTRYTLIHTDVSGIYYFDECGSGLILEPLSSGGYKLFYDSSNGYKLFNSDGYIIKIVDEFSRQISLSYHTTVLRNEENNDESDDNRNDLIPLIFYEITIQDYLGNIVYLVCGENTLTIRIGTDPLNILQSFKAYITDNIITSIEESDETRLTTLTYSSSDNRLLTINEYGLYSLAFSYNGLNGRLDSVETKYNNQSINSYSFEYGVRQVDVTDFHNVTTRYLFDDECYLIANGEVKDGEASYLAVASHNDNEKFASSLNDMKGILFSSSSFHPTEPQSLDNTTLSLNAFVSLRDFGTTIEANKAYLVCIQLIKDNEVPFNNKNEVPKLTISQTGGNEYEFEYSLDVIKGLCIGRFYSTVACDFSSNNPQYSLSISFPNTSGLVKYSSVSVFIIECKGYLADYYFGLNNEEPSLKKPGFFSCLIDDKYYSSLKLNDLVANYINKKRNKPFFWNDNKHELVYVSTYPSEYLYSDSLTLILSIAAFVHNHTNINLNDIINNFPGINRCYIDSTLFGNKTITKYIDDPNETLGYYPIYNLTYLRVFSDHILTYDKTIIKNSAYLKTQKYDFYQRLLKVTDYDNTYQEYTYDSYDNVLSKKSGKEQQNDYIETNYTYDSLNRLISISSTIDNVTQTTSINYTSRYRSPSSTINANNVTISYSYDSEHRNVTSVSNGNSSIDSGYTNSDLDTVSNDSEINLLRDSKNLSSGYNVLFGNNQYKQVLTRTNNTNFFSEKYLNKQKVNFNKTPYQNLWYISENISSLILPIIKASFLYFDEKPDDILNVTSLTTDIHSNAKLYKIIDQYASQNTYYDYDDNGRLDSIDIRNLSNTSLYVELFKYDDFERLREKVFYCSSRKYKTTFHYLNDIENTIDSLVLYAETPNLNSYDIEESITLDPLKRISNLNQIDNGEYELNKDYNYHSSNNKTSVYPYRIDYSYIDNNNTSILQKSYYITYNSLANITSIKEGNTSSPTPLTGSDYVYDNLNQLIEEINYQSNIESRLVYSYDNNGNITSVNKYDLNNNLISTDSYSYHSYYKDLLISFNNNSITYDDALNPISYNGMTFAYSNRNKLISFTKNNVTYNYKYNYNGIRTEKTVDNILKVKYVLDGSRIIKEERQDLVNNTNINLIYLYGQQGLMGIIKDETLYRVITNVLGDVAYIYQGDTLLVHYVYDAYGNHKVLDSNNNEITNTSHIGLLNPFRYRSYYYDQESGLYYCNARYYYPVWRRWLTPDHYSYLDNKSLVGINLFAYCKNNPVMLYDPEGNTPKWLQWANSIGRILTGIFAIAAGALVIISGVAVMPMLIIAGLTILSGAITLNNGIADTLWHATGYNYMRDGLFQGNNFAYNLFSGVIEGVAFVGSVICGSWLKYNSPRISAYNGIENYTYSATNLDAIHMARPWQESIIMQKSVIKYGKMIKDGTGWAFEAAGFFNSSSSNWRLVLDVVGEIIWHWGPF